MLAVAWWFSFGRVQPGGYRRELLDQGVGAKWFDHFGYEHFYDVIVVALVQRRELVGDRKWERDAPTRNLHTGVQETSHPAYFRGEPLWDALTEEQRTELTADLARFPTAPAWWRETLGGMGLRASPLELPVLRAAGGATGSGLRALAGADLAFLVLSFAVLLAAYGPRVAGIAGIVFGVSPVADYASVGGSLLALDTLFFIVLAVALWRKRRPAAGGMALGLAIALGVWPAIFLIGPAAVLVAGLRRLRDAAREAGRFLSGTAGALAVVALLLAISGQLSAMKRFALHVARVQSATAERVAGLRTAVVGPLAPSLVDCQLLVKKLPGPPTPTEKCWSDGQREAAGSARWLLVGLALLLTGAIGYAATRVDGPSALALGAAAAVFVVPLPADQLAIVMLLPVVGALRSPWPSVGVVAAFVAALAVVPRAVTERTLFASVALVAAAALVVAWTILTEEASAAPAPAGDANPPRA